MIIMVFAAITLAALVIAAFVDDVKRATLALWVAGLSIGCLYLSLGAEVLAIIQWLVSTLVAISFVFFSVMFGEYGADPAARARTGPRRWLHLFYGIFSGGVIAAMIWLGGRGVSDPQIVGPAAGNDLFSLGRALTEDHLISLEVLALTLLLVLMGGGVIARPDAREERSP